MPHHLNNAFYLTIFNFSFMAEDFAKGVATFDSCVMNTLKFSRTLQSVIGLLANEPPSREWESIWNTLERKW